MNPVTMIIINPQRETDPATITPAGPEGSQSFA